MEILGREIKTRRQDLGLGQGDLADRLGVTQQTISRWEGGVVLPPPKRLAALAEVLELKLDRLLSLGGYFPHDIPEPSIRPLMTSVDVGAISDDDLYLVIDLAWEELRRRRTLGLREASRSTP